MSGGTEQLQAVKDYIAKYNLEDELSNAVNQAIKLDSDDPYRVISDYLRQFAKVRAAATYRRVKCAARCCCTCRSGNIPTGANAWLTASGPARRVAGQG